MPGNAGKTAYTIRPAGRADLTAIVRLLAEDSLGAARERLTEPLPAGYTAAFAAIDADPRNELAVVEAEGEVIGCLQLTFLPGLSYQGAERAQIEGVRIAESRRGQGIGGALIEWAVDRARQRGCRIVQLTTNKTRVDAQRFYGRLGFTASHEGMKLTLTP